MGSTNVNPFGVDLSQIKVEIVDEFSYTYNLSLESEWTCSNCYNNSRCQSNEIIQWKFRIQSVDIPFNFKCRSYSYINSMSEFNVEVGRNKMIILMKSSGLYERYYVFYMNQHALYHKTFDTSQNKFVIDNLMEKTVYRVCIAASDDELKMTNYKCKLVYSDFLKTGPVTKVKMSAIKKRKLEISWNKPEYKTDKPDGYLVSYTRKDTTICQSIAIHMKLPKFISKSNNSCKQGPSYQWESLRTLMISDLEDYTLYEIRIRPINGDRESIDFIDSIWTAEGESGPVENLQLIDFRGYFEIDFSPPVNPKGLIRRYKMNIKTMRKSECDKLVHTNTDATSIQRRIYYRSDTIYEIKVSPINGFGLGQSSQIRFYSNNHIINSPRSLDFKLANYKSKWDDKYLIILHKTKYNDEKKVILADKFTNSSIKFDNLNECTKYHISLQHINSNFVSTVKRNWCQFTNAPDLGRVVIKPVVNNTDRIKLIKWIQEGSANDRCPIDYLIRIIDIMGNVVVNEMTVQNWVRVRNLEPEMKYNVDVVSYSNAPSDSGSYRQSSYKAHFYTGNVLITYDEQSYSINNIARTMLVSWSTNHVDARAVIQYFIAIKVSYSSCFILVIMKCRDCPTPYNEKYYSAETLTKIDSLKVCVQIETRYFQRGQWKFEEEVKLNTVSNQYYIDVYAVNLMGMHLLFKQNQGIMKQYTIYISIGSASFVLVIFIILIIVCIMKRKKPIENNDENRASNIYDFDDRINEINEIYDSTEF